MLYQASLITALRYSDGYTRISSFRTSVKEVQ